MNYRIGEKEAFEMFGVSTEINRMDGQAFKEIPAFWDKCIEDGSIDRIHEAAGTGENVWCHGALYSPRRRLFSYDLLPRSGERCRSGEIPPACRTCIDVGHFPDGQG